jgi:2-polyprenyl-6-methoxyphenol hydroxylase-like FAD-dependent oxidoreductase
MRDAPPILIAGAGPTGLVLALWLARLGVRPRIIDKAAGPGTTSRALAVHARTLEFYDQIGLAAEVVARGLKMTGANLWVGGVRKGRVEFGDMGQGISPFPFALIFPQDEHERLLIEHLAAVGITVEREIELTSFEESSDGVTARLRRADGSEETALTTYLVGCDGAHSAVREGLGLGFPGGTYSHLYYVADVEAAGPAMNRELNLTLDETDFLAIFPLAGEGRARFIGTVKGEAEPRGGFTFEDVRPELIQRLGIKVGRVNWFSTYHVHHRVAGHFRKGRVFLAGDAAHIHSPVGGQGMNTGIGDAVNLAWKLAAALGGRADPVILDSYEPERIAFARRLVASTDRAFTFINNDGALARIIRKRLVPWLLPRLFRIAAVRRVMFRTISQTSIQYRGSMAGAGKAGKIAAGDRLPWVPRADGPDNFAPLRSLDWQAHVYGELGSAIERACGEAGLPLHRFPWSEAAATAGLARGALYAVRPDGYVGLAATDPAALDAYRARLRLVFAKP